MSSSIKDRLNARQHCPPLVKFFFRIQNTSCLYIVVKEWLQKGSLNLKKKSENKNEKFSILKKLFKEKEIRKIKIEILILYKLKKKSFFIFKLRRTFFILEDSVLKKNRKWSAKKFIDKKKTSLYYIFHGIIVQLVRAPPCHGGSCGFESR